MKQSRVWTKVLAVVAILYGLSRLDGARTVAADAQQASGAAAAGAVPDLQFEELKHNFGEIVQDAKVTHEFRFTNKGNAVLEIGEVRASCGCTAALVSERSVAPGQSGSIRTTFDSKFKKGPVSKTITVHSNDPDSPQTVLVIEGTIRTFVEFEPQFVNLGNGLSKGQGTEARFRIWRTDGQPFQIRKLQTDNENVMAEAAEFAEGGHKGKEVTVRLRAEAPPGRYSGAITVSTDIEKAPETTVRYFGSVRSDVAVSPKYAVLGNVEPGQAVTKTLTIQNNLDGQTLEVLKVTSPAPYLKAELKPVEAGRRYELILTLTSEAPAGRLGGEIVLETNLTDEPVVRIPVFGYVGGAEEPPPPAPVQPNP